MGVPEKKKITQGSLKNRSFVIDIIMHKVDSNDQMIIKVLKSLLENSNVQK